MLKMTRTDPLLRQEVEGGHRLGSFSYHTGPSEPRTTLPSRRPASIRLESVFDHKTSQGVRWHFVPPLPWVDDPPVVPHPDVRAVRRRRPDPRGTHFSPFYRHSVLSTTGCIYTRAAPCDHARAARAPRSALRPPTVQSTRMATAHHTHTSSALVFNRMHHARGRARPPTRRDKDASLELPGRLTRLP